MGSTEDSSGSKGVIIRVKRRRSASPVQALLLNAKRQRRDDDDTSTSTSTGAVAKTFSLDIKQVFAFAGSIGPGEEKTINELLDKLKKELEPGKTSANQRSVRTPRRKGVKESTKAERRLDKEAKQRIEKSSSRYTVIQAKRNIKVSELIPDAKEEDEYDVVTVEQSALDLAADADNDVIACNDVPLLTLAADDQHYTYDFYYSSGRKDLDFKDIKGEILGCDMKSAQQFLEEPEFQYDSESDIEVRPDYESEDSNAEDNWRNDYPDELSDDDDEFYDGFNKYNLRDYGDEIVSNSSSEEDFLHVDEEEDLVHSMQDDTNHHGKAYARFKRQMMRDFESMGVGEDKSEDSEDEPSFLSDHYD